jgi:hypothetical protein
VLKCEEKDFFTDCFRCAVRQTFSRNGEQVIRPLNEEHVPMVGEQMDISFYDGFTVNQLYGCAGEFINYTVAGNEMKPTSGENHIVLAFYNDSCRITSAPRSRI